MTQIRQGHDYYQINRVLVTEVLLCCGYYVCAGSNLVFQFILKNERPLR